MVELPGYHVRRLIGRGAHSVVHEATQLSRDRAVALRILTTDPDGEDGARRFRRDRELLSRLGDHRHVVDVYDAGVAPDGRPWIAMRLCRRGSLAGAGPLDLPAVVAVVRAVASALEFAHGQGVVHRDVKPANVLLADDGTPLLADLGLAAPTPPDGAPPSPHAAPEVVARGEFSPRSDVYALASTAATLLTGRDGVDPADAPELPAAVAEVLARGTAPDPADRFTGAQDLAFALAAAAEAVPARPARVLAADAAPDPEAVRVPVGDAVLAGAGPAEARRDRTGTGEPREPVVVTPVPAVTSGDENRSAPAPLTAPVTASMRTVAPSPAWRGPRLPRSRALRAAVVGVPLLVVLLVAGWWFSARDAYTLIAYDGLVALRHGGSGSLDLESQEIPVAELKLATRRRLSEGIGVDGRADAATVVARLRAEREYCQANVADGCPPGPLFRPRSFSATPLDFPHGDQLRVSWSGLDTREAVTTRLAVDGEAPRGCDPVLTGADGECTITVGYGRSWDLTATVTGPFGTRKTTARASATTPKAPVARVFPGRTFTQKGATYCSGLVEVTGFEPDTEYRATLSASNAAPSSVTFTTDGKGHYRTAEGEVKYGFREDRANPIAVDVAVGGVTGRTEEWRC